jgi:hypothetical protein
MKTTIKLVTVLVLTLLTLGQHTNASAGGGLGFNFKGPTAIEVCPVQRKLQAAYPLEAQIS